LSLRSSSARCERYEMTPAVIAVSVAMKNQTIVL
jgi:hypothetical protein